MNRQVRAFNALKNDLCFFDRPKVHFIPQPRPRKTLDDLYDDAGLTNLNAEVEAYLEAAAKAEQLPDSNCYDITRFLYDKARLSASDLLTWLSLCLDYYHANDHYKPMLPWTLKRQLHSGWPELIADVRHVKRDWQCTRHITEHDGRDSIVTVEIDADLLLEAIDSKSVIGLPLSGRSARPKASSRCGDSLLGTTESRSRDSSAEQRSSSTTPYWQRSPERPGSSTARSVRSVSARSSRSYHKQVAGLNRFSRGIGPTILESDCDGKSLVGNQTVGYWTVLTFQLSSKTCREKGWIVSGVSETEFSLQKVLEWAVGRLRTSIIHKKDNELHRGSGSGSDVMCLRHFYGDTRIQQVNAFKQIKVKKPRNRIRNVLDSSLMPQIPATDCTAGDGRPLHRATLADGSCVVFYPSGHAAIVISRSCRGPPSFYTVAYADDTDRSMLACFTPSGRGACYRQDGTMCFVATATAGWLTSEDGFISRKWDWPEANGKLMEPITIQLNAQITFHCVSQQNVHLTFTCDKEITKVCVGSQPGAETAPTRDELGQLLSGLDFDSKAAKNFLKAGRNKLSKPPARRKFRFYAEETPSIIPEVPSVVISAPVAADTAAFSDVDPDVLRTSLLQRIKTITEMWLEHYRTQLGLTARDASIFNESLLAICEAQSPSRACTPNSQRASSSLHRSHRSSFLQSAPTGGRHLACSEHAMTTGSMSQRSVTFDLSASTYHLPSVNRSESEFQDDRITQAPLPHVSIDGISRSAGQCPDILRHSLLGETSLGLLRCNHRTIPCISDAELDVFLRTFAPPAQLIVICVMSSLCHDATPFLGTLEKIYADRCRTRPLPCIQSHSDPYRLLLYDTATAAMNSGHAQPLLSRRHNIVAGMFLMYRNGRLLFCDHIFNGYGNDVRDFMKQLHITNTLASKGQCLPDDFLFSPQYGPHGVRSAWGGSVGGAGLQFGSTATTASLSQGILSKSLATVTSSSCITYQHPQFVDQVK